MGGPCDFCVRLSPLGLDFGTLDFGTSDSGLTTRPGVTFGHSLLYVLCGLTFKFFFPGSSGDEDKKCE